MIDAVCWSANAGKPESSRVIANADVKHSLFACINVSSCRFAMLRSTIVGGKHSSRLRLQGFPMAELFFRNALEWAASLRDERPVAPMKPWTATYTGRRTAWIYLPLGTFTLAAVILGLIFAEDTLLFFILCCVPALFVVWVTLVGGLAAAATRITLSDTGIEVSAPTWRGTPLPPIRRISAAWSDVISVRRRTEIYPIGRGGFEVPAWELKTRSGTVVFGGRIVPGLTEAMGEIARRAHVAIIDDGAVGVSPIRALVQGTPDWSHDGDR